MAASHHPTKLMNVWKTTLSGEEIEGTQAYFYFKKATLEVKKLLKPARYKYIYEEGCCFCAVVNSSFMAGTW